LITADVAGDRNYAVKEVNIRSNNDARFNAHTFNLISYVNEYDTGN